MRGNCFSGGGGGSSKSGIVGIVLMAVGVLVLLLFVLGMDVGAVGAAHQRGVSDLALQLTWV